MSEINTQAFEIVGSDSQLIRGNIFRADSSSSLPAVIFCHGFKGFKDWGCWPYFASSLTPSHVAVTFNFSHNGIGEDLLNFTREDLFGKNTFSKEVEDLNRVIDYLATLDGVESDNITLVGHSRGGVSAIEVGATNDRVRSVVTLASVANIDRFSPEDEKKWKAQGQLTVLNTRTGQRLPLGLELLEDINQQKNRVEHFAKRLDKPLLVIHGDADPVVSVEDAKKLDAWAPNSQLIILPHADHVFGTKHPFGGTNEHFEEVIEQIKNFLNK